MLEVNIRIRKEFANYNFDDGKSMECEGIRVMLAPKIEKFFILKNLTTGNCSNYDLLGYCNPNLCQWFSNVPVGSEIVLTQPNIQSGVITDIYKNQEDNKLD